MGEPGYSYIALCHRDGNCANYVQEVTNGFQAKLKELGLKVAVRKIKTICSGRCRKGVFVDVGGSVFYGMVKPVDVASVVKETIMDGDILPQHFLMERFSVDDEKIIYDRDACILIYSEPGFSLTEGLRELLRKEGLASCGKCIPCRLGVKTLDKLLSAFIEGKTKVHDIERVRELAEIMDISSRCALAGKFIAAILVAMDHFGQELNLICVLGEDSGRTCRLNNGEYAA
ncbi:MAG: NADH-ubiquinone oxidoreductase-F iron-sulfur binding region domain-containing protein [Pseudomonadota bacterium]